MCNFGLTRSKMWLSLTIVILYTIYWTSLDFHFFGSRPKLGVNFFVIFLKIFYFMHIRLPWGLRIFLVAPMSWLTVKRPSSLCLTMNRRNFSVCSLSARSCLPVDCTKIFNFFILFWWWNPLCGPHSILLFFWIFWWRNFWEINQAWYIKIG